MNLEVLVPIGLFFLVLTVTVFVHETGHAIVAMVFGAKLRAVYIGLPGPFGKSFFVGKTKVTVTPWLVGAGIDMQGIENFNLIEMWMFLLWGVGANFIIVLICSLIGGRELIVLCDQLLKLVISGELFRNPILGNVFLDYFGVGGVINYGRVLTTMFYAAGWAMLVNNLIPIPGTDGWNILIITGDELAIKLGIDSDRYWDVTEKIGRVGFKVYTVVTVVLLLGLMLRLIQLSFFPT